MNTATTQLDLVANVDTDDALVARIAMDDESALATLEARYSKRLRAIAFALVGDEEIASAVVHDVFLDVLREWPPEHGEVGQWLARRAREHARRRHAQRRFLAA